MSDSLYAGRRFGTFNVIDDFNRELLHVEIDTSITVKRLILFFERLAWRKPARCFADRQRPRVSQR